MPRWKVSCRRNLNIIQGECARLHDNLSISRLSHGFQAQHETDVQVHAVNLIKLRESGSPFGTSHGCKLQTGSSTTNKVDCHS